MFGALSLLHDLTDGDVQWIFDAGAERQVIIGTIIVQEGMPVDALWFVLDGLVGVSTASTGARQIGTLGPGETIGEMAFLEGTPATATITAVENSLLLAIPFERLQARIAGDPAFAARVYKSFAIASSRRLRQRVATLAAELAARQAPEADATGPWARVEPAMRQFKETLAAIEREMLKNDGHLSDDVRQGVVSGFYDLVVLLNQHIGDASGLDQHVKDEVGARVQIEMLPYLLLTKNAERCYSKPRGYAGDFLSIEMIYQNQPGGAGRLGPLLDEAFLAMPSAHAVRNRRGLLVEEIERTCGETNGDAVRVTSLACGPAREVFDVIAGSTHGPRLIATLLDIDLQALAFVADRLAQQKLTRQVTPVHGNLVYLATGRQKLDVPPQDLVYSLGLIDYFNDAFVIKLLNYVHGLLRPGGRVILGNFHTSNVTKALQDYVLDWKLIHRSEDDMNRLFAASAFGRPCTAIRYEPAHVNLFAIGEKGA